MFSARWLVSGGALLLAAAALYVLLQGYEPLDEGSQRPVDVSGPALDDIDEGSRSAMRELLRRADREE